MEEYGDIHQRISEAIERTMSSIAAAAKKSGRKKSSISVIAVTKTVSLVHIEEAIKWGLQVLGESKVQEALPKMEELSTRNLFKSSSNVIRWHLIGHLQKNKVKFVVGNFDLIHSVDSLKLARLINDRASSLKIIQNILLQVNISGELNKYGFSPDKILPIVKEVSQMNNISLRGLMTIPPHGESEKKTRNIFSTLRVLSEMINEERIDNIKMKELSMGMSDDYMIAIEEGATMVRIGRGIFGERKH